MPILFKAQEIKKIGGELEKMNIILAIVIIIISIAAILGYVEERQELLESFVLEEGETRDLTGDYSNYSIKLERVKGYPATPTATVLFFEDSQFIERKIIGDGGFVETEMNKITVRIYFKSYSRIDSREYVTIKIRKAA